MIGPLNVLRVEDVAHGKETVWVYSADSLAQALVLISKGGLGEYVIESKQTGNRRLYAVESGGEVVYVGPV